MKQKINFLALLSIIAIAFSACSLKEKKAPLPENLDLAVEEVFAEDLLEDVFAESFDVIFDASEYGILKSEDEEDHPDCRIKTVVRPEGEKWPKVVTLDFGDGCKDMRGNIRKGKIIITIVGKYREEESTRTITFEDYFVNDNQIEGEKLITNTGREGEFLVFSIELSNGKITRDNGVIITRNASKTRMWIEGEETPRGMDDVFVIIGTVNKVNKDGVQITKTIRDLVRARNCRWPLSGTVDITTDNENWPGAILDYGDGECDKWATVTIGEGEDAETWIINLNKKGKNWRKQDDSS